MQSFDKWSFKCFVPVCKSYTVDNTVMASVTDACLQLSFSSLPLALLMGHSVRVWVCFVCVCVLCVFCVCVCVLCVCVFCVCVLCVCVCVRACVWVGVFCVCVCLCVCVCDSSNWTTTKQLFSFRFCLPWNLPPFPSLIRLLLALTTPHFLILPGTFHSFFRPWRSTS